MHCGMVRPSSGASRSAISSSWARPRSRAAASSADTSVSLSASMPGRATHMANTNGRPDQRCQRSPKSQTAAKRPGGDWIARSPINRTASAEVSARVAPMGSGSRAGARPNCFCSRIWTSAALVREPSSSASVAIDSSGTRLNSLTLSTGPRQAMQALEMMVYDGFWKNSMDGIKATSSRPAARSSARRLGRSNDSRASGPEPSRPQTSGLVLR